MSKFIDGQNRSQGTLFPNDPAVTLNKTTRCGAIRKIVILCPEPLRHERDAHKNVVVLTEVPTMLRRLKTITLLLNAKAMLVASLAVLSTYLCMRWDISANFPLTLIATAIVFPIGFSINSAYKRRESAIGDYASLKSHGRAIFLQHATGWKNATRESSNAAEVCSAIS